jgi:tricorn protease interacting factor F2/3
VRVDEYELDLEVDHPSGEFRGTVSIDVVESETSLRLDCVDLTVASVRADGHPVEFHTDGGRALVVAVGRPGTHRVEVAYSGRAGRDTLNGFYVSSFGAGSLLTTMMQPTGCRRLLPCVDEPDAKAVFRLRVTTDARLTVVANGDVSSVDLVEGRKRWTFAPTPRMSTYLFYLGVGPFDAIETTGGPVRIIAATPPGKAALAQRALSMAGPLLKEYAAYYGLPYPLPKLHLVAVPDLWAGGMENWGAIVVPEIGLLWDDATSPAIVRWAVETMAHEIAHQWFGNLVTTKTWDDLWLNESFATFVASKMEDRLGLRSNAWAEFLIRTAPGYFSDSYAATHPVRLTIRDPAEISQSTDDITYYKGANVVRMIETYLGEAEFRQGVSDYLRKYAYSNATEDDLWQALETSSGQPVRSVMRAWVDRAGFPVLRVQRDGNRLAVEQRRFTFRPDGGPADPWPIPLRLRDGPTDRRVLFDQRSAEWTVEHPDRLVLNPDRTSFVRLWYDPDERARRIAGLAEAAPFDRWAFVNDAFAFVLSGDYRLEDFLATVRAVREVTDYPTIEEVVGSLRFLRRAVGDLAPVDEASRAFLAAQHARLGEAKRPGEIDTDAVDRQSVARSLVLVDPAYGRTLARGFADPASVDAALRPAAAVAYAAYGGEGVVERLYERMRTAPRQDDAEQAALAAEGLPSEALVTAALDRCMEDGVRLSLSQYLVRSAAMNPVGREPVWRWLTQNLREFERRAEGSWMLSVLLGQSIPVVGVGREGEVRAFFERESFPEATNGIRRGLELLAVVGALRERLRAPSTGRGEAPPRSLGRSPPGGPPPSGPERGPPGAGPRGELSPGSGGAGALRPRHRRRS